LKRASAHLPRGFLGSAKISDAQVLRQAVLGGHEILEKTAHRLDFDSPGDVSSEGIQPDRPTQD